MLLTGRGEVWSDQHMTTLRESGIGRITAVLIMTCQDMNGIWRRLLAGILLANSER